VLSLKKFAGIAAVEITISTEFVFTTRAGFRKSTFLVRPKGPGVSTSRAGLHKVSAFSAGFTGVHLVFVQDFENEFVFVKKYGQWAY
jgi:hypothetical protein